MTKITKKLFLSTAMLCSTLLIIIITLNGCTSDDSTVQDPIENSGSIAIKILEVTKITATTATVTSTLDTNSDNPISAIGVCISTSPTPVIDGNTVNVAIKTGSFDCNFKDLISDTKYYVRAFTSSKSGITYSSEMSFTTAKAILDTPKVVSGTVSAITSTSAIVNTSFENIEKITVLSAGIYLSTSSNPTSTDAHTTILLDENYNTKKYTTNVNNLTVNTCLLYTSPSPRDLSTSRMPSSA